MSVGVKEIVQDYVLICFDIPQSAGKLRKTILRRIYEIGGVMHTSSNYLIPYSDQAMELANDIADSGQVVVWKSKQENTNVAKAITMNYESHLHLRCDVIDQRLAIIASHIFEGRLGKANRMAQKTHDLLEQLKQIANNYHTDWLPGAIEKLSNELSECYK